MNRYLIVIFIIAALLLLAACAPGVSGHGKDNRANFFRGVWHGWIAPITLIWGLFDSQVRIYEVYNTGWGYDFGFYIAVIAGFGGLSLTRRRKKR
jgi:predicted small secreted protein